MPQQSGSPRKVVVGTSMLNLWGPYPGLEARLRQLGELIDEMAALAAQKSDGARLDIAALPEFAVNGGLKGHCRETAQVLEGPVLEAMAAAARRNACHVTVPLYRVEDRAAGLYSNVVALLDRRGEMMGLYRFAHPSVREMDNGLMPGGEFPVFECDFGRVGIQICGDVHYDDGWLALREQAAELVLQVAQPATPQEVALRARAHRYFILTSTWRDLAALVAPTGHTVAEIRRPERVMVERIDLSYVVLGWQPPLANGEAFDRRYGDKAGHWYWPEDDCGVFWSNDQGAPITAMVRELGLVPLEEEMARNMKAQEAARKARWGSK